MILSPSGRLTVRTVAVIHTASSRSRSSSSYVKRLRQFLEIIPAFSVDNTWKGASEIVKIFRFSAEYATALKDVEPSADVNYCACVSWKPTSNTRARYKLWENVGEVLYVDLYDGQKINSDFDIEIWSTNNTPIIEATGITVYTSNLLMPSSYCDNSDRNLGITPAECLDLEFNFTADGFNPAFNHYYEIVEVGNCLIAVIVKPDNDARLTATCLLLRVLSDGYTTNTDWHCVQVIEIDGEGYLSVNQEPSTAIPAEVADIYPSWFPVNDNENNGRLLYLTRRDGEVHATVYEHPFTAFVEGRTEIPLLATNTGNPFKLQFFVIEGEVHYIVSPA